MKYKVMIQETTHRTIEVDAPNAYTAIVIARTEYEDGLIDMSYAEFDDARFDAYDSEGYRHPVERCTSCRYLNKDIFNSPCAACSSYDCYYSQWEAKD